MKSTVQQQTPAQSRIYKQFLLPCTNVMLS